MNRVPCAVRAFAAAAAVLLCACEAVPNLTFASSDGAPGDIADARTSTPDALDAASGTGAEAACPDQPPSGVTACCGSVPCTGDCDAHCSDCQTKCSALGSVCCAGNAVTCHSAGFVCK